MNKSNSRPMDYATVCVVILNNSSLLCLLESNENFSKVTCLSWKQVTQDTQDTQDKHFAFPERGRQSGFNDPG